MPGVAFNYNFLNNNSISFESIFARKISFLIMTKNKLLIYSCLFLFSVSLSAQENPDHWKVSFQLDNRFSSIHGNEVTVFGGKIGLQYKKLFRFGLGAGSIMNPVYVDYFNRKLNTQETNKINFWYFSFFNDWILYKGKKWEILLTEQIGYGRPKFIKEIGNDIIGDADVDLYINEISGQINYKITPWFGVGAGAGYRALLNNNPHLDKIFNSPIYIAKIIIYPGAILNSMTHQDRVD